MGLIFDAYGSHLQRRQVNGYESNRKIAEKLKVNQGKTERLLYGKRNSAAKKRSVKKNRTKSDYRAAKKKLIKKADSQTASMRRRTKIYAEVADGGKRILKEPGGAQDKDMGTEALSHIDHSARQLRRRAAEAVFTPQSSLQAKKLSKLERKKGKLEQKRNDNLMKEFFNNVHKDEGAAMQGLGLSKKPQVYRSCKEASISKFSEDNKKIIQREMQKKRNRLQYRMAAAGNGASDAAKAGRKALFSKTSLTARTKAAAKETFKKILAAASSTLIVLAIAVIVICALYLAGMVFVAAFSNSTSTSSWVNMTAIINDFTQKETSFVVPILNSKNPSRTDIRMDEYEWYVIVDGTETEVTSETDILDTWKSLGQADQNKLMAFISTLQIDATQENAQWLIDAVLEKMYSLSIEVDEREEDIPGCDCGCQDTPATPCFCPNCAGTGDTEITYVQVTKFYINNLDDVIEQLYSQYATEEKKEELKSFYTVYQATRGGQTSLGSPLYYHWYTGAYSVRPSSYSGWRFLDRGDGNGYTVEPHEGLDIPAWVGAGLFMPFDGTIQETGYDDARGNYVIMLNESGNTKVTYKHMSTIMTEQGEVKGRATRVGSAGNTGDSTGAHLHIDIQMKDEHGNWTYINPLFACTDELPYKRSYGEGAAEDEME